MSGDVFEHRNPAYAFINRPFIDKLLLGCMSLPIINRNSSRENRTHFVLSAKTDMMMRNQILNFEGK